MYNVLTVRHLGQYSTLFYVACRWTGSNTNPNNNDGQGRAGTDRSNVVLLHAQNYAEGMVKTDTFGHWGNSYPEDLDTTNTSFLGLSRADRQALATLETSKWEYMPNIG